VGRTLFAWLIGTAYTLFWSSLGILTWPLSPRGDLYLRFARTWSSWILGSLGIPLVVTGAERLDPDRPYVFMSNHRSVFDIFALFLALDQRLRMVAKRALFFIPVFGWSMGMCGFVPIDRSNRERAIRGLERAARRIRGGLSVLVFPEGTRGSGRALLPFKKGVFVMALEAGVPVVPVVVSGTEEIMPSGSLRVGRGSIAVAVGEPIDLAGRGRSDRDWLMSEVRREMQRLLESGVRASS